MLEGMGKKETEKEGMKRRKVNYVMFYRECVGWRGTAKEGGRKEGRRHGNCG